MDHLLSGIVVTLTHLAAGVIGALLLLYWIEPRLKRSRRHRELEQLSWLFPISKEDPKLLFKCSLKPRAEFAVTTKDADLSEEFFGRKPPTYRRYVHSAEALALQRMTGWLSSRGVELLPDAFYGDTERSTHLLLIGSEANLDMSGQILQIMKKRINYEGESEGENRHKYFECGDVKYACKHSAALSSDGLQRVTEDCGVIVRVTLSDNTIVLLLAGIHMHGTLAAAEVALNPAFQHRVLQHRYASFAQLVRVKVSRNGTSIDRNSLEEWRELPFVRLD